MVHLGLEGIFDVALELVDVGRGGDGAPGGVGRVGELPGHHLGEPDGVAGNRAVAAMDRGGGLLAFHGGQTHLAAGHAEVGVVDHDDGDVLTAVGGVEGFGDADVVGVAVALVGDHQHVGIDPLHAGGYGAGAAVAAVQTVALQAGSQVGGAAHADGEDDVIHLVQLLQRLHDEAADDAVAAAGAEVHRLVDQGGDLLFAGNSHISRPPLLRRS